MSTVLVFAFDPVEEIEGRSGVVVVEQALAERLIAEHRAEAMDAHGGDSMRYITGSAANVAAANEMREARDTTGLVSVRRVLPKKTTRRIPRLEG